jgi:hypothetical protein
VLVVALLAACGGPSGPGAADLDRDTLVGQTEQGMRMRIEVVDDAEVELRLPVDCRPGSGEDGVGGAPVSLHRHPLRAQVGADGSFRLDVAYVEDGTGGDAEHVDVRLEGVVEDDGGAVGTVSVQARWWDDEGDTFADDCTSGTVAWAATQSLRDDDIVVPGPAPVLTAPAGPDLVTVSEQGALARREAATGMARPLGVDAPPSAVPGPGSPVLAVAADGVWSTDPATGVPQRTELADGSRTAAMEAPVGSLVAGPDALWSVRNDLASGSYLLERRDPVTGEPQATAAVAAGTVGAGPGGVWYAYRGPSGGRLERIDPSTAAPVESYAIDPEVPSAMVVTEDRVWMAGSDGLTTFDTAAGHQPVDLPSEPGSMTRTADGRGIWVAHEREAVIRRVEATGIVRTIDVPEGRWRPTATDDGAVWLTGGGPGDERTIRLDATVTGG